MEVLICSAFSNNLKTTSLGGRHVLKFIINADSLSRLYGSLDMLCFLKQFENNFF